MQFGPLDPQVMSEIQAIVAERRAMEG